MSSNSSDIQAKFVTGSTMSHIWTMTTTAAIGLMGIFVVDLLDMFFLSLLDDDDILAGVGFAATLAYFSVSLSIGLTISMAALVSRSIGQGDTPQARRFAINILAIVVIFTSTAAFLIWYNDRALLSLLGASGRTLDIAASYLNILLPSLPL